MLMITWLNEVFRSRLTRRQLRRRPARKQRIAEIGRSEVLEDRILLAATTFVNDTWNLVTDTDGSMSVTAGDVVDAANDPGGPAGTFVLDDGTGLVGNAYGVVTTGAFTGAVATADTIQEAIGGTTVGGTVNVLAGTYIENVLINKQVNLLGAQSGVDARGRAGTLDPSVSSIITSAAGDLLTLQTGSAGSVIDGFTLNGAARGITTDSGPIDGVQILNNQVVGFTDSAVFLNDSGVNITVSQNVFDGASQTSTGAVFHLDQDNFDGFQFLSNQVLNGNGTGLFVDGNHNIGVSGTRAPLIQGNLFQNNNTGANLGRFAFEFGTITENTFDANNFDGLQGGIQNSDITRNTFSNNGRSGLALTGFGGAGDPTRGAQNNQITENFFFGNVAEDVLFSSGQFPGTISTNTLFNNSLTSAVGVTYNGTETIDASGNWWGVNTETGVRAKIAGTGAAFVDSTPFLDSGTDTDLLTAGFQGDFSVLNVTTLGAQAGSTGRIQEAVNLATTGGTVNVLAGTYTETVTVNKTLTILGAQAGVDARTGRVGAMESIVNGPDGSFALQADNIVLDGFTVEGTTNNPLGTGIFTSAFFSGYQIRNNIIQDNPIGLYLNSNGTIQTVVEQNLVRDNNNPGAAGGTGIYSDSGLSNAIIQDNLIAGDNPSAGINLIGGTTAVTNVMIVDNAFEDGNQLVLFNVDDSSVSTNTFTGELPGGGANTAIFLGGGDDNVAITGNTITDRAGRAISATDLGIGFGVNSNLTIDDNTITQNIDLLSASGAMINLRDLSGTSSVSGNSITLSGTTDATVPFIHGIDIGGAATGTVNVIGNTLNGGNIDTFDGTTDSAGIRLRNTLTSLATINIQNNFITGWVNGIAADALALGVDVNINENSITGNSSQNLVNGAGETIDASANWWGSNDEAAVAASISGPVDFTPFLNSGTDQDLGTEGFQGDFSILNVTALGEQVGLVSRIEEGVDLATVGGTVNVGAGTFTGPVAIDKDVTVDGTGPTTILDPGGLNGITLLDGANVLTIQDLRITNAAIGILDSSTATITSLTLANLLIDGSLQGGSLSDISTLDVTLTANADTANIDSSQFNSTGLQSIAYSGVGTFDLSGDNGSDTFNVDPIDSTMLTVNGDLPTFPADPGDTLNYNGPGTVTFTTADSGTITQPGFNPVDFTGIETITTGNVTGTGGSFTITAGADADDGDPDEFIVRQDGMGNIEVIVNGVVVFSEPAATVTDLTIQGSSDDDTMIVDYVNGSPVPDGGLDFRGDGPDDNDEIVLRNGTVQSVTHNFTDDSSGSIVIVPLMGNTDVITYTGLEPITDMLIATDRTFNYGDAADDITLSDDDTAGNNMNRISSASTSETVDFASPTGTLTVNMAGGDDRITLEELDSSFAADVSVNGGNGRDTFDVLGTTGTGTYQLNGEAGADEFNITPVPTGGADIIVSGGPPGIQPGDVLNYDGSGNEMVTVTGPGSGTISDSGFETVTFSGIETLNTANPPTLSIADAQITEGTGGTTTLNFTVTLTNGSLQPVTVTVGTETGLAIAGEDFTSTNQTLTFTPGGPLTQTFSVPIITDDIVELDEPFFVILSTPSGATIEDGVAQGLILDDDGPATISIDDVTQAEGDTGTTMFTFTVTMDREVDATVTVDASTMMASGAGAATAGVDYITKTQTLTFLPGETTQTFTVQVQTSTIQEFDEFFLVNLSNVQAQGRDVQISSTNGTGTGIIQNDDSMIVTGADASPQARINVFDQTGVSRLSILAFDNNFMGGVRVATGDFNDDGTPDIVAAAGPGGGPHIRIFDGVTGEQIAGPVGSFYAFDPSFTGGVFVALADINGDSQLDIIAGADAGGGPHVRVFDGSTGAELLSFFAFEPGFTGGVRVAGGDVTGDGTPDIIAARGPGGDPEVRVFDGDTGLQIAGPLGSFLAYDAGFTGGVYVAAGDLSGDTRAEIITGAGAGGGPHVKVFSPVDGSELLSFFAFASGFSGGVRVAAGDMNADGELEIIAAAGPGAGSHVRSFDGETGLQVAPPLGSFFAFEISFTGGVFVAGVIPQQSPAPMMSSSELADEEALRLVIPESSEEEIPAEIPSDLDEFFADENLLGDLLAEQIA